MKKWLEDKKVNLGGVRRPIERERKAHTCNNCFRFNHKMDKCPYGKQCINEAATTTLQQNVEIKKKLWC